MGLLSRGWSKNIRHYAEGAINMGNWKTRFNEADQSIDIEHATEPGIPYIRGDTSFNGEKFYMTVEDGGLIIEQFPGWDEDVGEYESYELSLDKEWDEDAGGEELINYLFNTSHEEISYEYSVWFVSNPIALDKVGRHNDSRVNFVSTIPQGATLEIYTAVYNPILKKWGDYLKIKKDGDEIDFLPSSGVLLAGYKLKYKVIMRANSLGETPSLSEVVLTLFSTRHFRVYASGKYEESSYITDSVIPDKEEVL